MLDYINYFQHSIVIIFYLSISVSCSYILKYSYQILIIYRLYGFKYSYQILIIYRLYGFKYSYQILIIYRLYGFKYSYQILIIYTQLYGFK